MKKRDVVVRDVKLSRWPLSVASRLYDEGAGTNMIYHYEEVEKHLRVDKLWSASELNNKYTTDIYLEDSWLKYLLHLIKVDDTSAYLMYKNSERKQNENENQCLGLGCYESE